MRTRLQRFLTTLLAAWLPCVAAAAPAGHWAHVNGHRLYYESHGGGRALLLLHGGGATPASSFGKQLATFASSHRVIAPEQAGHGHSPDLPGPLSYTQMTEDTAALLKLLHVRHVDVVGFSDGGIVALMLAVRHPELVRRVVVSGANLAPDGLEDDELARTRDTLAALHRPERPVLLPSGAAAHGPSVEEKLVHLWLESPTRDQLNPALLARIHNPVLVMAGERDLIKRDHTLEIVHALPAGRLYVVPDASHGTFAEQPERVNSVVLAFLDSP
jgi:pimeloyl-ACP methyl ester carboxylesterase